MKRGSLRAQLIAWNTLSLALLLGVLAVVIRYTVTSSLLRTVDRELEQEVSKPPPRSDPSRDGSRKSLERDDPHLLPRHFSLEGKPLGVRALLSRESFEVVARRATRDSRRILLQDEPFQILSVPMYQHGHLSGVVQAGYRLTDIEEAIETLDQTLLLLLPVGLFCAVGGGILLTSRVLRRVRGMTQTAQAMGVSGTALDRRLPVSGNDEFSELATVLNSLLAQQQNALTQQRRFTADASHELQSPLTVIKGMASMALESASPFTPEQYQHFMTEIDHSASAMVDIVQDLLLLARSDTQQLGQQPIEILISEVLERALRLVTHEGPPVTIRISDPTLSVWGNEGELIRLFTNLISNARRYTPATGTVTLTATQEKNGVMVTVADTGIGIDPEHLPRLGERFYRIDSSRNRNHGSTGLGLSICYSIVAAHGGEIKITSKIDEGTTVRVRLPQPPSVDPHSGHESHPGTFPRAGSDQGHSFSRQGP